MYIPKQKIHTSNFSVIKIFWHICVSLNTDNIICVLFTLYTHKHSYIGFYLCLYAYILYLYIKLMALNGFFYKIGSPFLCLVRDKS